MKDAIDITVVLDRSGSMAPLVNDTIGGFNTFLKEQQEQPTPASLSLIQFDHEYSLHYAAKDIKVVDPLNERTYVPRGSTALLDAVGKAISWTGTRLSNTKEEDRPSKVMVIIITDGQENDSTEFSKDKIKEMIEHQEKYYNWQFVFLGANQDSFAEAGSMGISLKGVTNYVADSIGVNAAFVSLSNNVSSYRGDSSTNASYKWGVTPDMITGDKVKESKTA